MEAQGTKMPECSPPLHTYCMYCTTYSKFWNPSNTPPPLAQQPLIVQQGLLIIEASQSHSDAPYCCRTCLDGWSVWCKDLYLTTHSTHKRHQCTWWDSNSKSQQANGRRPTPYPACPLGSARIFNYCMHSRLVGRPVLICITSLPYNQFCLRTVNKSLTKSLPEGSQINAPKSVRNWFMTGHSTPSAIKMFAYVNYSTFWLVHEQPKLSSSNCPGSPIITANGWTLSLGKPNKVQNLQVSLMSPGTKCYQITYAVFMSFWRVRPVHSNTL
jgi:hypothetical protein